MKHYILKRNNPRLMNDYLCDLSPHKMAVAEKRVRVHHKLLLIERTVHKDNTESTTNIWTVDEGCAINWEQYTKKRQMWDYTGVVHPLIHENGIVQTYEQHMAELTKQVALLQND